MKAFVINLSKNTTKYFKFKDRFIDKFGDSLELERFDAFNGSLITYDKLRKMGYDTYSSWREPSINRKQTHGEIGCSLSHLHCWQYAHGVRDHAADHHQQSVFLHRQSSSFEKDKRIRALIKLP